MKCGLDNFQATRISGGSLPLEADLYKNLAVSDEFQARILPAIGSNSGLKGQHAICYRLAADLWRSRDSKYAVRLILPKKVQLRIVDVEFLQSFKKYLFRLLEQSYRRASAMHTIKLSHHPIDVNARRMSAQW
eukprot:12422408-Karenia_brevis.AAC.1